MAYTALVLYERLASAKKSQQSEWTSFTKQNRLSFVANSRAGNTESRNCVNTHTLFCTVVPHYRMYFADSEKKYVSVVLKLHTTHTVRACFLYAAHKCVYLLKQHARTQGVDASLCSICGLHIRRARVNNHNSFCTVCAIVCAGATPLLLHTNTHATHTAWATISARKCTRSVQVFSRASGAPLFVLRVLCLRHMPPERRALCSRKNRLVDAKLIQVTRFLNS